VLITDRWRYLSRTPFSVDNTCMSVVGSSLEASALQAVQAQHVASKARDREKSESASGRRFADLVDLRVAGVESGDALRGLPSNDSEQGDQEREGRKQQQSGYAKVVDEGEDGQPHVDVKA
jgi:hypothetical protein